MHVPIDAPVGPIEVRAFGRNAAGEILLSSPEMLDVVAPAQLISMSIYPSEVRMSTGSPEQQLRVMGYYDDGVFRELDPILHNITFSSDDVGVAVVDSDGTVTGVSSGSTLVHILRDAEALSVSVQMAETPGIEPLCDGDANGDDIIDVNDISYVLFRLGDPCAMPGCEGDANVDGFVDVNDISYVLFRFGLACSSCDGDANNDGAIDVNDISYVLFRLGNPGPDGDANGDVTVDVNDISYVLFRLGNPCP